MKLWKKLMPVATAAATVACVVPMASCSKSVFSTSDLAYKPEQVAATTTAIDANAMVKEYFKDSNRFVHDMAYTCMVQANDMKPSETVAKNIKLAATITVNSVNVGAEKEVTLPETNDKTTGYTISGSLTMNVDLSYDKILTDTEKSEGVSAKHYDISAKSTYSMTDAFVYFTYSDAENEHWQGGFYCLKDVSTNWKAEESSIINSSETTTYENGAKTTKGNNITDESVNAYSEKAPNYPLTLEFIAYTFDKVLGK